MGLCQLPLVGCGTLRLPLIIVVQHSLWNFYPREPLSVGLGRQACDPDMLMLREKDAIGVVEIRTIDA